MHISKYSFQNLPFSDLFKTYISNFAELSAHYEVNPFCESSVSENIAQYTFSGNRNRTVRLLESYNQQFDADDATFRNIERLKKDDALAIVTGQQLGIYGGPLYTYFKILSTIHLAQKLEKSCKRPVIPVFWLADEDHDYDEVRTIYASNKNKPYRYELPARTGNLAPVADQKLPDEIEEVRSKLKDTLYNTDFSDELWKLLDESFEAGRTFSGAFGRYISALFSSHGLVLAGSNNRAIKEATKKYLKQSISKADEIRQSLEKQSNHLKEKFHQQVTLYDSNLFYLSGEERIKISRDGKDWIAGNRKWTKHELQREIEKQPHKFSPNVFMRPILQDALLPTLGYVAGPGEVAYFAQMKDMYRHFAMKMPIVFPRLSGTFIEPAIDRIKNELPFELHEYANRIEDLETAYVDRTEEKDIEKIFSDWKQEIDNSSQFAKEAIVEIDPTLEGAAEKATTVYCNELDKLKTKVYRAVKKKDDIQLKRVHRIKANLFPNRTLQERVISGISFMNKYGVDIWDRLLDELNEESFNHHKIIYL